MNEDGDGPLEWCRPVPDDRADELAAAVPELTLRTEPAHQEAFVHLGTDDPSGAQWQLVSESLHAWAAGQDRRPSDLGVRVVLHVTLPRTADSGPNREFAVPLQ